MEKLLATMVRTCDRLLELLTGPRALTDPEAADAAREAIALLQLLESQLSGAADGFVLDDSALDNLQHRTAVLEHVNEVLAVLCELGLCRLSVAPAEQG